MGTCRLRFRRAFYKSNRRFFQRNRRTSELEGDEGNEKISKQKRQV